MQTANPCRHKHCAVNVGEESLARRGEENGCGIFLLIPSWAGRSVANNLAESTRNCAAAIVLTTEIKAAWRQFQTSSRTREVPSL
jgi:hypothetical protein